jgi:energy-coupling factor transport system substrate-specific component
VKTNLWSTLTVASAGLASLLLFFWPLIISQPTQSGLAQAVFIALMPLLLIVLLVEFSSGSLDSRQLALLGVFVALNSVIRLLGAGVSGIETAFFLIILGAFVFGSGFGFILGAGSLFVSALMGAGVGPWLPFQMMAAGLVGLGAGLFGGLRIKSHAIEMFALCGYAILASFAYGALMTLWNWPFLAGQGTSISYQAGAPVAENLVRFFKYEVFTGGLLWDLGRATTTVALLILTGRTLLTTMRRAGKRAGIRRRTAPQ